MTQSEFDRQAEITRLLLEGISSTHAHHLRCLNDFVEAQMTYFAQCYQYMLDLQKQLGSFPTTFASNNNQSAQTTMQSVSLPSVSPSAPLPAASNSVVTSGFSELKAASGNRKARVLYDYDAANSTELSLLADEGEDHIYNRVSGMDPPPAEVGPGAGEQKDFPGRTIGFQMQSFLLTGEAGNCAEQNLRVPEKSGFNQVGNEDPSPPDGLHPLSPLGPVPLESLAEGSPVCVEPMPVITRWRNVLIPGS
ncbi:unnamed protein product [Ranitomeya imitator]|uniref:BAR domain-containing protein n=1 Tax=Ranitomeya imitator TaxID=111125 RepID=A0ABN9KNA5_9NEOB|nr:unnamed protein product [Ranitomeya imitator]